MEQFEPITTRKIGSEDNSDYTRNSVIDNHRIFIEYQVKFYSRDLGLVYKLRPYSEETTYYKEKFTFEDPSNTNVGFQQFSNIIFGLSLKEFSKDGALSKVSQGFVEFQKLLRKDVLIKSIVPTGQYDLVNTEKGEIVKKK